MSAAQPCLGFIGLGTMGCAMIRGLTESGKVSMDRICGTDKDSSHCNKLREMGGKKCDSIADVVNCSDIVFVAVEPAAATQVMEEMRQPMTQRKDKVLVVSIVAGCSMSCMEKALPQGTRVLRVMPNTPLEVQECVCAIAKGTHAKDNDVQRIKEMLESVGMAIEVSEKEINAFVGLAAAGPVFVYMLVEAMAKGGVAAGMNDDMAMKVAMCTVKGAAKMMKEKNKHPSELTKDVCSRGGPTKAAMDILDKGDFGKMVTDAVTAVKQCADEMDRNHTH